jgi:hypothetical protein
MFSKDRCRSWSVFCGFSVPLRRQRAMQIFPTSWLKRRDRMLILNKK